MKFLKFNILFLIFIMVMPLFAAEYASNNGDIKVSADVLQMSKSAVRAKNKVNLVSAIGDNSVISVKCNNLKVVPGDDTKKGLDSIKEAIFSDKVIFNYTINGKTTMNCIAYSDSAYYDGATKLLTLSGHVKIDYVERDGSKVSRMSAKGSKAVINMKENQSNDELIFSIEGDEERSTLSVNN